MSLPQLTTGRLFLTDGGLETTLVFHQGLDLPDFAAFPLLDSDEGRAGLIAYYTPYLDLAERLGTGFVLDTPTWRANLDWGARLGYDAVGLAAVNHRAVEFVTSLAAERPAVTTVVNGVVGPRGDGYVVGATMSAAEAAAYHGLQARAFAEAGAEMVSAITMTYAEEAIGVARAAAAVGLPAVISFTVETDGRLPSGQTLGDAIAQVDDACHVAPAYYMVNCAHPTHFRNELEAGASWLAPGPRRAGQRLAPEPRRAGRGHRTGPWRHRRARRAVRRPELDDRPAGGGRVLRHRPRARRHDRRRARSRRSRSVSRQPVPSATSLTPDPPIGLGRSPWRAGSGSGGAVSADRGSVAVERSVVGRGEGGLLGWLGPSGRRALFGAPPWSPGQVTSTMVRSRASELVNCCGPRPARGEVQGEFAARAGDPSGGAQVTAAEGVGGDEGFAQADAAGPAGEVVGGDVQVEPGGVGAEAARRQMVEAEFDWRHAFPVWMKSISSAAW